MICGMPQIKHSTATAPLPPLPESCSPAGTGRGKDGGNLSLSSLRYLRMNLATQILHASSLGQALERSSHLATPAVPSAQWRTAAGTPSASAKSRLFGEPVFKRSNCKVSSHLKPSPAAGSERESPGEPPRPGAGHSSADRTGYLLPEPWSWQARGR